MVGNKRRRRTRQASQTSPLIILYTPWTSYLVTTAETTMSIITLSQTFFMTQPKSAEAEILVIAERNWLEAMMTFFFLRWLHRRYSDDESQATLNQCDTTTTNNNNTMCDCRDQGSLHS